VPPPWFVDERCRDLKIVSSFEALAVNARSPSVIVGSQVVPNSAAENLPNSDATYNKIASKITWLGQASILHFCWARGENIKQIMFHHTGGLQGLKIPPWQGIMSSGSRGLGSAGRAGEAV